MKLVRIAVWIIHENDNSTYSFSNLSQVPARNSSEYNTSGKTIGQLTHLKPNHSFKQLIKMITLTVVLTIQNAMKIIPVPTYKSWVYNATFNTIFIINSHLTTLDLIIWKIISDALNVSLHSVFWILLGRKPFSILIICT